MTVIDAGRFTVGVFQDSTWARNGLSALVRTGLPPESLSVIALATDDASALINETLGGPPESLHIAGLGDVVARGPIVRALQGEAGDLETRGLSGTMRRVGFQPHDARIYDALTARGGVLVAIHSEPRAADALAVLHAYGGGNAAIGAWSGRV
jgi:hypothetical protein